MGDRFLGRSHKEESYPYLVNFDKSHQRKYLDIIFYWKGGSPSQWMVGLEYLHLLCVCVFISSKGCHDVKEVQTISFSSITMECPQLKFNDLLFGLLALSFILSLFVPRRGDLLLVQV